MHRLDSVRIKHMRDAAQLALDLSRDRDRADLDSDVMLRLALVKLVEIIGEAATQVTVAGRASFPGVEWEDMIGTRHRLVHAYFDINLDILWQTVQDDLPNLLILLQPGRRRHSEKEPGS